MGSAGYPYNGPQRGQAAKSWEVLRVPSVPASSATPPLPMGEEAIPWVQYLSIIVGLGAMNVQVDRGLSEFLARIFYGGRVSIRYLSPWRGEGFNFIAHWPDKSQGRGVV